MKRGDRFLLTRHVAGQEEPAQDLCLVEEVDAHEVVYKTTVTDVFGDAKPSDGMLRRLPRRRVTEALRQGAFVPLAGTRVSPLEVEMLRAAWEVAMEEEWAITALCESTGAERHEVDQLEAKLGLEWKRESGE